MAKPSNRQAAYDLGCVDATIAALIFIGDHDGGDHLFKDVARGITNLDDILTRAADIPESNIWTYLKFYGLLPQLYRLRNSGQSEWWIIADTPAEAIALSVKAGMARSKRSVRLVSITTEHHLRQPDGESLRDLLDQGTPGFVAYQGTAVSGSNFLASLAEQPQTPSTRSGWVLTRDLSALRED